MICGLVCWLLKMCVTDITFISKLIVLCSENNTVYYSLDFAITKLNVERWELLVILSKQAQRGLFPNFSFWWSGDCSANTYLNISNASHSFSLKPDSIALMKCVDLTSAKILFTSVGYFNYLKYLCKPGCWYCF